MKQIIYFISFVFTLIGCDNNNDTFSFKKNNKLINTFSCNDKDIDSLFYKSDKLISITHYFSGNKLYTINYEYNTQGQLLKIYKNFILFPDYTFEYMYNSNGSLKSIRNEFRDFGSSFSVVNYNYVYSGNKIIITDDDYRKKTHETIATLDSKNRIQYIEKQKESLNGYFTSCEYIYNNNDNIITAKIKSREDTPIEEFNFEYDNKINPFPLIDFNLPNGLSIKKLESISYESIFTLSIISLYNTKGVTLEYYNGFLDFQNTNNVTQMKIGKIKKDYTFNYNNENYPVGINYNIYNELNGFIKITYK